MSIHPTAVVEPGAHVADDARVWHWVHVRSGAKVGPKTVLGKDVFIDTDVSVGAYCKIQNFATLYRGLTVGDRVFVGPHACFTNDLPPHALVAGVPAKVIGWVCECGRPLDARMRCAHDGRTYPDLKPKRKARSRRRK